MKGNLKKISTDYLSARVKKKDKPTMRNAVGDIAMTRRLSAVVTRRLSGRGGKSMP